MEQKEWEERLDRYADRTAQAVRKGVGVLEDAFDRGRETLNEETAHTEADEASANRKGSRRLGLILVLAGIVWLLNTLGVLGKPVFPILVIVLGIYLLTRTK